jgi:hypothetical protein
VGQQRLDNFYIASLNRPPNCCFAKQVLKIDIHNVVGQQCLDNIHMAFSTCTQKCCSARTILGIHIGSHSQQVANLLQITMFGMVNQVLIVLSHRCHPVIDKRTLRAPGSVWRDVCVCVLMFLCASRKGPGQKSNCGVFRLETHI